MESRFSKKKNVLSYHLKNWTWHSSEDLFPGGRVLRWWIEASPKRLRPVGRWKIKYRPRTKTLAKWDSLAMMNAAHIEESDSELKPWHSRLEVKALWPNTCKKILEMKKKTQTHTSEQDGTKATTKTWNKGHYFSVQQMFRVCQRNLMRWYTNWQNSK